MRGRSSPILRRWRLPDVYRERIETGLAVKVLLQIGDEFYTDGKRIRVSVS